MNTTDHLIDTQPDGLTDVLQRACGGVWDENLYNKNWYLFLWHAHNTISQFSNPAKPTQIPKVVYVMRVDEVV